MTVIGKDDDSDSLVEYVIYAVSIVMFTFIFAFLMSTLCRKDDCGIRIFPQQ